MANEKHLAILGQCGVGGWNKWRKGNPNVRPDLSGANLVEAKLVGANLNGANLRDAYLLNADLSGANLRDADLLEAVLSGANLRDAILCDAILVYTMLVDANFSGADLRNGNLRDANLHGANLKYANLCGAYLRGANLRNADLRGADLSGADLSKATLVEANFEQANLNGCHIYGVSAWNVKLEGATQSELVITRADEPMIKVDDLEVAQFVYLLLDHKKLRNVLNAVTGKGVLILGRFGDGGLEILQAIAQKLRDLGYLPMIFDFERPESRNYTETIKTLASLSRFIIADLSGPSVPQELYATVPHFKIPFIPIIDKSRRKFAMFVDILEYPWVLDPIPIENKEQLINSLPEKIIEPAEEKHQERQKRLDELFN